MEHGDDKDRPEQRERQEAPAPESCIGEVDVGPRPGGRDQSEDARGSPDSTGVAGRQPQRSPLQHDGEDTPDEQFRRPRVGAVVEAVEARTVVVQHRHQQRRHHSRGREDRTGEIGELLAGGGGRTEHHDKRECEIGRGQQPAVSPTPEGPEADRPGTLVGSQEDRRDQESRECEEQRDPEESALRGRDLPVVREHDGNREATQPVETGLMPSQRTGTALVRLRPSPPQCNRTFRRAGLSVAGLGVFVVAIPR